jgi:hypothetical protein
VLLAEESSFENVKSKYALIPEPKLHAPLTQEHALLLPWYQTVPELSLLLLPKESVLLLPLGEMAPEVLLLAVPRLGMLFALLIVFGAPEV